MSVFVFSGYSYAAENDKNESSWSALLGVGAKVSPEFEGLDKYKVSAVPVLDINIHDWFFISTTKGVGVSLIKHSNWSVAIAGNYNQGRKEKDSDLLTGPAAKSPLVKKAVKIRQML